ncbi:MAG: lysylphosphatidylglycerol synthase transmembrane domain-containing protein [Candidatus Dormibacteria bacterium]
MGNADGAVAGSAAAAAESGPGTVQTATEPRLDVERAAESEAVIAEAAPRRAGRRRELVTLVVGLAISALVLWRVGIGGVWHAVRRADMGTIAAVIALNVPVIAVRALRTRGLLRRLHAQVPFARQVTTQLVGQTMSAVTPAASGDLSRAYLWHRDDGVPVGTGFVVVAAERGVSFVLLGAVGLACSAPLLGAPPVAALLVGAGAVLVFTPWLLARGLVVLSTRLGTRPFGRWQGRVGSRGREVVALIATGPAMALFTGLTLVIFALSGLQIWLLAHALGAQLSLVAAVGLYGLSQAAGSLSGLPFGLGTADAVTAALLLRAGAALEVGAALTLLVRACVTVPTALVAVALIVVERSRAVLGLDHGPARVRGG